MHSRPSLQFFLCSHSYDIKNEKRPPVTSKHLINTGIEKSLHTLKSLSVPIRTVISLSPAQDCFSLEEMQTAEMCGGSQQCSGQLSSFEETGKVTKQMNAHWLWDFKHVKFCVKIQSDSSFLSALSAPPLLLYSVQGCAPPAIAAHSTVLCNLYSHQESQSLSHCS